MVEPINKYGLNFQIDIEADQDMGPPWKEHDGHGIVTLDTEETDDGTFDENRYLSMGRGRLDFYDLVETRKKAKEESWGLNDEARSELAEQLNRAPTDEEIIEEAVQNDYRRMKAWCNDEWQWVGVLVTLLDVNGDRLPVLTSLWGIESDSGDEYFEQVANDLIEELMAQYGVEKNAKKLTVRDTTYTLTR